MFSYLIFRLHLFIVRHDHLEIRCEQSIHQVSAFIGCRSPIPPIVMRDRQSHVIGDSYGELHPDDFGASFNRHETCIHPWVYYVN